MSMILFGLRYYPQKDACIVAKKKIRSLGFTFRG